jgi:hypothetical protein
VFLGFPDFREGPQKHTGRFHGQAFMPFFIDCVFAFISIYAGQLHVYSVVFLCSIEGFPKTEDLGK